MSTKNKGTDMTDAERQALSSVLEYLVDEKEDYESCVEAGESVDKHIYTHIQVLEGFLERHTTVDVGRLAGE